MQAFVQGTQVSSLDRRFVLTSAMPKHFQGYDIESDFVAGGHNGNYRLMFNATISRTDYVQTYTPAFAAALARGARTLMCSYQAVLYPLPLSSNGTASSSTASARGHGRSNPANRGAGDGADDGATFVPMCASPLLQQTLREAWNFSGVIFSDGGAVRFINTEHHYAPDLATAAADALLATVDLNSGGKGSDFAYNHLNDSLARGLVTEDDVRAAVRRLMRLRFELGMFEPSTGFDRLGLDDVDTPAARSLARRYARESLVLLRNDGAYIQRKLWGGAAKTVALIGPNADSKSPLLANCEMGGVKCVAFNPLPNPPPPQMPAAASRLTGPSRRPASW